MNTKTLFEEVREAWGNHGAADVDSDVRLLFHVLGEMGIQGKPKSAFCRSVVIAGGKEFLDEFRASNNGRTVQERANNVAAFLRRKMECKGEDGSPDLLSLARAVALWLRGALTR